MYSADGVLSSTRQVSPFRHLPIKACLAAPRSLSQPRHVFHQFLAPKHPPYTLCSLTTLILMHPALPLAQPPRRLTPVHEKNPITNAQLSHSPTKTTENVRTKELINSMSVPWCSYHSQQHQIVKEQISKAQSSRFYP
jgi:hypothetical protein